MSTRIETQVLAEPSGQAAASRLFSKARVGLIVVATVLCMALAFRSIDLDEVGAALGGASPRYAALAFLLILLSTLVAMVRFRVLLGRFDFAPPWRSLFTAFSVGLLGNQFAFNVIGQSVGRAGILVTSGVPFAATVITTVVERIFAAAVLAIAGVAAGWFLLPHFGFGPAHRGIYFVYLVGGLALVTLAALAVTHRRGVLAQSAVTALRGARRFWSVLLLTVLAHLLTLGGYIASLLALGLETPTLEAAGGLLIVMFAAALPISVSGWGIRELGAVAVLGAVGIEPSAAFAGAVVVGLLSLGVNLAFAVPSLFFIARRGGRELPVGGTESLSSRWNERLVTACGMLAAVTIFFQARIQGENQLISVGVADVFALVGLGGIALMMIEARGRLAVLPRAFVGVLIAVSLLLGYGLLLGYVHFGANTWALVNRGLGWGIILGFAALGLSVALLDDRSNYRRLLRVFVAAGAAVAAIQLLLLIAQKLGFTPLKGAFQVPLRGFANNANAFAFQMTITAVAAIVAHHLGLLGPGRRWLTAVLFATGLAVLFSTSRAGIVTFVLVLTLYVSFALPPERREALAITLRAAIAVAVASVVMTVLPFLTPGAKGFELSLGRSMWHVQSNREHIQILLDGWNLWLDRPIFGNGLGAYVETRLAETGQVEVHHSVPMWLLSEMGIVGLGVGLVSFGFLVLSARRIMRTSTCRILGTGLMIALICWGFASQVHDFFYQRTFWFFVALAFGIASVTLHGRAPPFSEERSGIRPEGPA